MIRLLATAALLAVSACARQQPVAPVAPAAPAPQTAPQSNAAPAPAPSAQSETEQATASQETGGGDNEHQERSDASLEKIAGLPPGAQLPTGKWQPGVNYKPLVPAQPTSVAPGKVEVMEVFWLACPHCYALEPYLKSWLKSKPAYVEFVRVPVMWQPGHRAHAHFYYTLEALGRPDLVAKAFETIHQDIENHQPPLLGDSDDETFHLQQQFAVQNGVSADDFAKAYNSFTVNSNLQRAEEITQRYRVEGVPLVVVNGKYTTDVAEAGGEGRLIELINDLVASEHGH
ncbi:MAG TPA: thiol:disulfide interchange protein DsbA/DsbL [Steroidobacteraceae bacterium]|jgi:thiol:disulfide interchange protein DsbA|nr:thiol:disulfide interchange protein DsbA/DsbL [Steroidobacteraceae bacterium]